MMDIEKILAIAWTDQEIRFYQSIIHATRCDPDLTDAERQRLYRFALGEIFRLTVSDKEFSLMLCGEYRSGLYTAVKALESDIVDIIEKTASA